MYKKIMAIESGEDMKDIKDEFEDRFGDIPRVTQNLMKISYIRAMAGRMDVRRVRVIKDRLILDYGAKSGITPLTLYLDKKKDALNDVVEILEIMVKKMQAKEA